MMFLVTVKLEDFLWTTKTCPNLNSSYNYIKNICFELSFLTFILAPVHENAYIKLINWLQTKCRVIISHLFSLISICSQLNTTRQKKAGLYIFCEWDSFVSLDTLKGHKNVLKICLTTQKSSQVTDILLRCSGAFNWMFLYNLVSVITESDSQ